MSSCPHRNIHSKCASYYAHLHCRYFPDNVDKTWPIVAISYLFVKQDLSALGETGAAVKAFLEYTQSSESGYSSTKGGQKFAAGAQGRSIR
jgi:hypothetical protein